VVCPGGRFAIILGMILIGNTWASPAADGENPVLRFVL
jgi:hypothetical protein